MPGITNDSQPVQNSAPDQSAPSGNSPAPDSGVNWSSLADDPVESSSFETAPQLGQSQPAPPPAPVEAPPTSTQQVAEQSPVAAAPATPTEVTPPQVGEAPQQQPSAPTAAAPEDDPVQLRKMYQETLQSKDYALSQEDALAFVAEPETALPRFAAQLHMRVMQDVGSAIRAALSTVPSMMQALVTEQTRDQEARKEFYGEWPGLEKHHETVLQVMQLVRNAQPNATKQQVITTTGTLIAMQLGVDPAQLRGSSAQPAQGTPPVQPQYSAPPQPAGVGSARNVGVGSPKSVWEQLATLDDDI